MQHDRVIADLTKLGLTSYEARAYAALTGRDSFTAAEVSRVAGLPRQRIYDVLASLLEKGLVSTRPGTVIKYSATEPTLAVEQLLSVRRQQLEALEEQAATLVDELAPAYRAGKQETDPLQYIEVLRDRGAINARFDELQAGVQREILVFTKPPYAKTPQENVEGLRVARKVTARSMYEYSLFEDLAATEGVRRFVEAGEQARVVPELPLKLVIIDETIVMFGMEDPIAGSSDLTIVVVDHPSLAAVLKMAFTAYWNQGVSFEQAYERLVLTRSQSA